MMDINDLRTAAMLFGLATFLALVRWAWAAARRHAFDAAAQLPFQGEWQENGHE